ncbi:MAG: hypothetical protein PHY79_24295 [Anaerolineae bacterium]|jgi:hypothetical protein|nr:hypothetical protein [Anaerolineae bacterium]MDX9831408.1 hypothetical protein [Anaerolineae bacterium]
MTLNRVAGGALRLLRENWLFLLIIGALGIALLALRTPGSDVSSLEEVEAILTGGQPTVVEFYSNT